MRGDVAFHLKPLLKHNVSARSASLVMVLISIAFAALVARPVWIQLISNASHEEGDARGQHVLAVPAASGQSTHRNRSVLAASLPGKAIFSIRHRSFQTSISA
ncbi:hypothetical protein [Paraburkholderia youngii]|uniref:Uncharacterized protein n=1 Tax=Paraburkholderia youngii TaxID=2782701 RepID=A0A7Y6K231_9BURK|nr:hypothetical protein [Paraburkholderia youngii]NUY02421.1 hypothetical protein [Paraburkholderia youngii]